MYKKLTKNLYSQKSVIKFFSRNVLLAFTLKNQAALETISNCRFLKRSSINGGH